MNVLLKGLRKFSRRYRAEEVIIEHEEDIVVTDETPTLLAIRWLLAAKDAVVTTTLTYRPQPAISTHPRVPTDTLVTEHYRHHAGRWWEVLPAPHHRAPITQ